METVDVAPVAGVTLSRTPHHFMNVLSPRGADQPQWLPRPLAVPVAEMAKLLSR